MLKTIILAIYFTCVSATHNEVDYFVNGTSWKCPSTEKVGNACHCDAVKLTIQCNGPTYQQLNSFFDELKTINKGSIMVDSFRLENYDNSTLDLYVFAPCIGLCELQIDLKFKTIDLRNNKNLKYIGSIYTTSDNEHIRVQSFLASNCSLIQNEIDVKSGDLYTFSYRGLKMIGSELEHVDFSHNYMTAVDAKDGYPSVDGYDWPNLKTLNLSWNRITDVGYQWFKHTPNVDVIDLSHNYIEKLYNEAFTINNPDPDKIEKEILIDLSHNRLNENTIIVYSMFADLRRPSKFNLEYNDFHYLPEAFAQVLNKRGYSIEMGNNQLICDCKSEWIRSMAVIYAPRLNNYTCLNLNNESIFKVTKNLCKNDC